MVISNVEIKKKTGILQSRFGILCYVIVRAGHWWQLFALTCYMARPKNRGIDIGSEGS